MNNIAPSTNPFADPNIPSMEAVLEQIESDQSIHPRRRREICSAIRTLERLFGRLLSVMPASPDFLRRLFESAHHVPAGISERRLKNIRSLIMAALRHVGISNNLAPYGAPFTEEWQSLMDGIESPYQKSAISRFGRYCSNCGVPITGVSDKIVETYLGALIDETLVKKPHLNVQTLCRTWNQIAGTQTTPHMPSLTVPRKESRNYAASEDDLSQALLEELNGYFHFLSGDDLIGGLKKPLRPRSIETNRGNIMRYLGALQASGVDIGAIHTLAELVDFKNFQIGLEWLWERFDKKPGAGIGGIAWTVRCVAIKHLECDKQIAERIDNILTRVQPRNKGLSPKNRASMQQFDDRANVSRFLNAPDELWALAQRQGKNKKGSLLAQSAVALDVLTFAPMRIENLQNLQIDQHLGWSKTRLRISIPADEVKNIEQLDFLLPEPVSAKIAEYMKNWRTLYFPKVSPYLFPGRKGGPKDVSALSRQITGALFKHTGIRLSPHQFRHTAAKILLDQKPGNYEVVRKVLGHKDIKTTYEHYAGAESQTALELYDTVILDVKNNTSANPAPKLTSMAEQAFLDPLNPFGKGDRR